MTIADLITRISAEDFNKADLPKVKTEFLNDRLGALEDVFDDVQTTFSALTELCGDFFTGTSFLDLVRKKILKHIENKSLRLDSSLDENARVAFFKNWVNCVATLYSLTKNVSFEIQQKVKDNVRASILNPSVLFHWIKDNILLEKQIECLAHVWNVLVLPSQSLDADSQPSLVMQRFFEFSVQHLSIEMLEALKSFQRISTYEAKSYSNSSGEIAPGFSALARAKICQAICKDILTAKKHHEFYEKFKQFSTVEISISDFSPEDLVKIFSRMEELRVLAGLEAISVRQDIKAFLLKQNVEELFECLLPQCKRIDSAGLLCALSAVDHKRFFEQLVVMRCEALLDKMKTWGYANNFDSQFRTVSIAYQVFKNNLNTSVKGYLTMQCKYLLENINIDTNEVRVSQKVFIDRVKSLASIESLLSPDNIKDLLKKYWEFSSSNKIESPESHFLQCFAVFQQRIKENVDLQVSMLGLMLESIEKIKLLENPSICWFIALVTRSLSVDEQSFYCRASLSNWRSTYKNDPKCYLLSSMLAYVEVYYESAPNSLLRAINHRQVTHLNDASKESNTGNRLNSYPKPEVLISAEVAATQLFMMPEGTVDKVQNFWVAFNAKAAVSTIFGRNSSLWQIVPAGYQELYSKEDCNL